MTPGNNLDLAIVGGGAAGLAAALYAARANLAVTVFEGGAPGGQIALTDTVENYPGLGVGSPISGPEIADLLGRHAAHFGAATEYALVEGISGQAGAWSLATNRGDWSARAVILATGSLPRFLGVPGESELMGRGVSTCATCDGAFFRGRDIVVVGGGDAALEEGIFLTRFANSLKVIHRRQEFRATKLLVERATANAKMEFFLDQIVTEVLGADKVEGVRIKNVATGEERLHPTEGVFIMVGHLPNTGFLKGFVELDEAGYIKANARQATSVPGIWAAGECADSIYRQLVTSAGDGVKASLEATRWLEENPA